MLGLYPGTTNEVEVRITNSEEAYAVTTVNITTDPLPSYLPDIDIVKAQTSSMGKGMHMAGLHLAGGTVFRTHPIIFDNNGDVRWMLNLFDLGEITWPIHRFSSGRITIANGNGIYEYDMLGNETNFWTIDGYRAHHDMIEMPNGNFLVSVQKYGTTILSEGATITSTDDFFIEFNPESGTIVDEWDLREILDVDRHDIGNGGGDWFHMNACTYSPDDDCFILSGRNQGIVKVNRDNELVWIMSPHRGWGKAGETGEGAETAPFLLEAVDGGGAAYSAEVQDGAERHDDFDWPWGPHAPMITEDGNIFLYDNGYNRQYGTASQYSRAVEYAIDENNMTVTQTWAYGRDRGVEHFSGIISDVDILSNGNRLMSSGAVRSGGEPTSRISELNESGGVVFEAVLNLKDEAGSGQFAWGQFDIMYRSERMNIYP